MKLKSFLSEWKVVDRSLAVIFAVYFHFLSADIGRIQEQFTEMSKEVKELNLKMATVIERTAVQKEDIADHKRLIEKNADTIQELLKSSYKEI